MALNKAFLGHSMYAEWGIEKALARYGSYGVPAHSPPPTPAQRVERFVQALKDMQVDTLWLQLFSRPDEKFDSAEPNKSLRATLFTLLAQADINWVGWGYCAGIQCARNKQWISDLKNDLGLNAFVLDIEPGNDITDPTTGAKIKDKWSQDDFLDFVGHANGLFGTENLAITTWPILSKWEPTFNALTMMKSVAGQIGVFNPQVYWGSRVPADYVGAAMKSWSDAGFANPLVVTGQAYWETSKTEKLPSQKDMETQVVQFVNKFTGWNELVGYGWYYAGEANTAAEGAMSDAMIATIKQAKLGAKPYRQIMAPPAVAVAAAG